MAGAFLGGPSTPGDNVGARRGAEAGWLVMYGVGGRRFYAIALGGEPLVVQAGTAEELCTLMRETEEAEAATPSGVRPMPDSHG
ncbi:hypothetical protein [Streptosporangium vulgare]|uniref:Roadblock/LAMTOR2 domain-containing protein n=1 Tax=Streptosporangium vulgare TaxID=46190 RepID=A0ABV5TG20_9ACTN